MLVKSMKIFFMSIIFMLNCFAILHGTTYYVSPSGSDNNPGTLDQPWKTIKKANLALQAGDTVYIRQGTYHETIEPARSGSDGKYITFASYPGEMATITDVTDGIRLYNKEYIRLIRLKIDYVSFWINAGYGSDAGVNHSEFAHLICTNGTKGPNYGGMYFRNSSYNWIHHCYISTCGTHVPDRGDAVAFRYDSFYNLFENNTLRYSGHELMNLHGSYNVIRKNDFQNLWDKCINVQDMTGEKGFREERGYRNLIGDNIFAYAQPSDAPTNPGIQFTANDCIIRRNRIFKNIGHGISAGALTYAPRCENNRIYHNTIYGNGGWGFIMTEYSTGISIDNNVLKNNILYYNNSPNAEVIRWVTPMNSIENNKIIANNILNKQSGENSIYLSGTGAKPVIWWEQNYPANFSGNIQVDPQFVDADNNNYELLPSSGCIDVGAFLSVITNSGSGIQIEVQDAGYFCDGFGIIEGDLIQLEGQTQTARITRVDYDNNTITIDRTLTWYNGQGVALPYNGSAPDIGAFEYGVIRPTASISLTDPSPIKAGIIEVILTTSKNVAVLPTPLIFTASDHSTTLIDLQGAIPGTTFTGAFNVNDSIAEGVGYFSLNPDALVDEQGNTGNEIVSGIYVKIDKTPPAKPKNLTARNIIP